MATFPRSTVRRASTSRTGSSFSDQAIQAIWNKATVVLGVDSRVLRKDVCGAWIRRNEYGQTTHNGCGWEIDHIMPVSRGGTDDLTNLQPLQWQNNREKGETWPTNPAFYKAVSAKS
jgi:5-methylcytosine-specific restriction endonuclease McrA